MSKFSRRALLQFLGAGGFATVGGQGCAGDVPLEGSIAQALTVDGPISRLTHEYGVRYPFVGAGMAFVSGPDLVAAVSNAGGIGVLGASPAPAPIVQGLIQYTKTLTSQPYGVDFINATTTLGPMCSDDHITACVEERVPIVVFFWNPPLIDWVRRIHGYGGKAWMQVGSVAEAIEANALGVDAIIAQGTEAGGHNRSTAPMRPLVHRIREAVEPTMVLGAGGIADGHGVARAFARGAEGVWVGTRLVASTEAYAHDEWKRRITRAHAGSTVRTTMFGPEWPGQQIRVLRNRIVNRWVHREDQIPVPPPPPATIGNSLLFGVLPYAMPKFSAILPTRDTTGDFEEMCMPAGKGAKLIERVQPAGDIVRDMMRQAHRIMGNRNDPDNRDGDDDDRNDDDQ